MVKILVKQDGVGVRPENVIVCTQVEEQPVSNIDGADEYEIDFADRSVSEHLENVIGTIEVDSGDLGFVQDLQTYESEENVICAPDLVLSEREVQVAAYATLSADCHSRTVPAVTLEANTCPMGCGKEIKSENQLRRHLHTDHATPIRKEIQQFPNMGSFLLWKEARERESCRRYVVRETRQGWRRFACSRSGVPSGTDRPQRWKKTGNFCPAFIRTTTLRDGSVKARFSLFHTCRLPDNSMLPSDRETSKANQQLDLWEKVVIASQPKRRRRKRKCGDQHETGQPPEPGTRLDPETEPELEPEQEPVQEQGQEQVVDEIGLLTTPEQTVISAHQPVTDQARSVGSGRGGGRPLASLPDRRKASPQPVTPRHEAECTEVPVKQRVRTNLLRLHAKLERASQEEALQMLADTERLLERHTTLRQRGTTGKFSTRNPPSAASRLEHRYSSNCRPAADPPEGGKSRNGTGQRRIDGTQGTGIGGDNMTDIRTFGQGKRSRERVGELKQQSGGERIERVKRGRVEVPDRWKDGVVAAGEGRDLMSGDGTQVGECVEADEGLLIEEDGELEEVEQFQEVGEKRGLKVKMDDEEFEADEDGLAEVEDNVEEDGEDFYAGWVDSMVVVHTTAENGH